ncbi:hypothetical protein NKR19_g9333 [Coniochaeta hoffmannii]|uniref:RlpA-like protein double-psi beta-barrel domain-containing protein n=1 Tax=Coniochaeta hoffmannii TaxID=91930 RepID=A0AA38R1J9_9PEZI|nr:hypothetical protein NKR19_g9333 [Coniochaeta hoffmannii]
MTNSEHPPAGAPPLDTSGGIEWETPRPRPPRSSLLSRLWPTTGPSRQIPTTKPASTASTAAPAAPAATAAPANKPEPTGPLPTTTTAPSLLDRLLPPSRTYLSLPRRTFLLAVTLITLSVLALILGLSIGLTHRSNHPASLPLPSAAGIHTGDLTYYAPGLGACGWTSSPEDAIAAVSHLVFDAAGGGGSNPNANPLCGMSIRVERDQGGGRGNKSVDVVVVDRCVGCEATDLDLSPSAFGVLADEALGRVVASWAWLE